LIDWNIGKFTDKFAVICMYSLKEFVFCGWYSHGINVNHA
jgi:hypothetical protein